MIKKFILKLIRWWSKKPVVVDDISNISDYNYILAKSDGTTLIQHTNDVVIVIKKIAEEYNLDIQTAVWGAILHDMGKASPLFQETLRKDFVRTPEHRSYRHEIGSIFFISLIEDEEKRKNIIDMIIAHHKSIYEDPRKLGILDLDENVSDTFEFHSKRFDEWCEDVMNILSFYGFPKRKITLEEAKQNYDFVVEHCKQPRFDCSIWKGVLNSADHLASALSEYTKIVYCSRCFNIRKK